jgi:hypothetical protein
MLQTARRPTAAPGEERPAAGRVPRTSSSVLVAGSRRVPGAVRRADIVRVQPVAIDAIGYGAKRAGWGEGDHRSSPAMIR